MVVVLEKMLEEVQDLSSWSWSFMQFKIRFCLACDAKRNDAPFQPASTFHLGYCIHLSEQWTCARFRNALLSHSFSSLVMMMH